MTRRKQNCPKRMKWEGGEGEPPPEGLGDEATPSEDEEEDSVDSSASQPASPQSNNPLEPETELILRDPASPSRDSRGSSIPPRCPSRDSEGSDRALPMAPVSPVSLLPPAFLPATQPLHRLVMTSPQGSVSPLVSSSSSPPMLIPANSLTSPRSSPLQSPTETDSAVLDFSTKRSSVDGPGLNLSKGSPALPSESSPLDLSVSSRKRGQDDSSGESQSPSPQPRKTPRVSTDFKTVVSPWTSPVVASHFPYFAAAVAAANSLSPKLNNNLNSHSSSDSALWNGKMKMGDKPPYTSSPVDATKALEKMSELSKLGGDDFRSMGNSAGSGGRHSAWQSHWLNKGADQAKDVLKCVWCKQSFPSLAAMTTHMKEAKHCGVNVPVPNIQPPPPPVPQPPQTPTSSIPPNSLPNLSSGSGKPSPADLNLLIKETMPLPRKLVRGQDVWLGKGAEQTRQILKCMWCGQSFRSLAEMTSHMQQTQHYTNIISQEQIISWKSADEGKSSGGGGSVASGGAGAGGGTGPVSSGGGGSAASSHVSAVLTCKVCDQAFSSLKELSNHMVKNSHYKEHIMRSITESGGRRRQTREKRKKSLPVRKLLELERAQNELKNGEGGMMMMGGKMGRDMHSAGRITCEKCGEKIDMAVFVDHIRICIGGGHITNDQRNLLKSALLSNNMIPAEQHASVTQALRESRKIKKEEHCHRSPSATDLSVPPASPNKDSIKQEGKTSSPSVLNAIEKLIEKSFDSRARHGAPGYGGSGGMGHGPIGSSILKRLGIDESVDYTKPLVDPQTMNLLRNYPHHPHGHFGRRERSGSESSSMSERGRTEASTPDRKYDPSDRLMASTPRTTPEKRIQTPPSAKNSAHEETVADDIHIKKEVDDEEIPLESNIRHDIVVKKEEMENGDDDDERRSYHSEGHNMQRTVKEEPLMSPRTTTEEPEDDRRSHNSMVSPGLSPRQPTPIRPASNEAIPNSPCRNSTSSPASSDRSGTPRSTTEKKSSGSLGALSSMFDSLSGGHPGGGSSTEPAAMGGKGTSHPLAALQKLCDKTETHHHSSSGGRPSSSNQGAMALGASSSQTPQTATTPGAILAFSWACNDAVVTADSIMKCAFCDTPFISKGAYRHHLSKMHFVKDGVIPDPVALKAQAGGSGSTPGSHTGKSGGAASTSSGKSPTQQNSFEESPHSKFLKYTELAKQLSSKYV